MIAKLPKVLGIVIGVSAVVVMIGWILDIEVLKSLLTSLKPMKFTTAISFFFTGSIIYFSASRPDSKSGVPQMIVLISSFILLLVIGNLLASITLGSQSEIENIFVKESELLSNAPGQPSLVSMINFILIASIGFLSITRGIHSKYVLASTTLTLISSSFPLMGYLLGLPVLHYEIEGLSNAMALHSAVLFFLTSASFLVLLSLQHDELHT